MGKMLVIVESPAKAKTINKYLGNQFIVKSSVGHIRDLPVSGSKKKAPDLKARAETALMMKKMSPDEKIFYKEQKAQQLLISRMGIDPYNDWRANYAILPGKDKIVLELRKLAEAADIVYLATDLDREGEAIAWHLKETIGESVAQFKRVTFNEITKSAITQAFENPDELNVNRVNAQQARRFLDRVVGYMISPLLWRKIARGLSAGRVQSVAVRVITEQERAIRKFVPEEYWELIVQLESQKTKLDFEVLKESGQGFKPTNQKEAETAVQKLKAADYTIQSCEKKPTKSNPSPPFITSTLQQAASTRLGFSVKRTMILAQQLYEAGYITYMRTDSLNLSQEALIHVREYIHSEFGDKYLPEKPNFFSKKTKAQEAHEAIRPSTVTIKAEHLKVVDRHAVKLYDLIWRQFVACQMTSAAYLNTIIQVSAENFELKAKGRIMEFDGFTRVHLSNKKSDDVILPAHLQTGQSLQLKKIIDKQLFTKPPVRFTEASLVKELEKQGIGRPSTYASIISTIQDRGYVTLQKRRFYAEKIGEIVTDRLVESFSNLMDYNFTAAMEVQLDEVAEGKIGWLEVLNQFYADFSQRLKKADQDDGMRINKLVEIDLPCTACQRSMQIRTASTGVFLGCSGYLLPPKERCKETVNLIHGDEIASDDEFAEVNALRSKHRCGDCQTAMDSYLVNESYKLHICGNNPDCTGYELEAGQFKIKGYEGPILQCDKCQNDMQLKSGRFGKYFACITPPCTNTRKLLKSGQPAPPKMDPIPTPELLCVKVDDHYVLRDGAAGLFLAASKFPKNRETRAPLLKELVAYRDKLDKKYTYLLSGPLKDPDNNDTIVRFSRKNQTQYLMTAKDGKATSWQAHYTDNAWVEKSKRAPKKAANKK